MDRGEFEIVLPPTELRPFVRRYLYANRKLNGALTFHGKPTGYAFFCNFLQVPTVTYGTIDGRRFVPKRFFIVGQTVEHDVRYYHAHALELLICELAATAPLRLLGIEGKKTFSLAASLEEAAPRLTSVAREEFARGPKGSREQHIAEANAFFARLAENALPPDLQVERAVAIIERANGAVRVADVCRQVGLGERQLSRKFHRFVGLSPKCFARILQINWVVGLLYANDTARLTEIAQEAGYYDQAHFNRSMHRFFNEGPREFLRSDHPAFRTFLAASRRYGPAVRERRS